MPFANYCTPFISVGMNEINAKNNKGWTALHCAVFHRRPTHLSNINPIIYSHLFLFIYFYIISLIELINH